MVSLAPPRTEKRERSERTYWRKISDNHDIADARRAARPEAVTGAEAEAEAEEGWCAVSSGGVAAACWDYMDRQQLKGNAVFCRLWHNNLPNRFFFWVFFTSASPPLA